MERQIVCFGIPSLDIALARLNDSELRAGALFDKGFAYVDTSLGCPIILDTR